MTLSGSDAFALVVQPGYADHSIERELLAPLGVGLAFLTPDASEHEREMLLAGAKVLFVRDTPINAETLSMCHNAKGLVRYGVGVDGVDLEAARESGIAVANIPDYGAEIEVADQTLALFLAVVRRVVSRDAEVRAGSWGVGQDQPIQRIDGKVLGLIGYGRIARAVHRRFQAFGIQRVLVHDPFLPPRIADEYGIEPVDVDTLAQEADIVSLHAPGGEPSRPIINREFLSRMRQGSVLINTSRGSHVDEAALMEALTSGRLAGAGLDVLNREPPALDNPLLKLRQVVLSDHCGWYSQATVASLQRQAGEEAIRILRDGRPKNWVNPW